MPLQNTMHVHHSVEDLPSPFDDPASNLSEPELRETAYEILVGTCRSSGPKPLTFISHSNTKRGDRSLSPSLHRSVTATAASKVKKALGLKTSSSVSEGKKSKRAVTRGQLMRVQMKVSELTDTRIRRALLRVAAGQHIHMELKVREKRTISHLGSSKSTNKDDVEAGLQFKLSAAASVEGIHQLTEAIAYKVIFHDLRHVLWDGLYVGEVSSTRIEPFLEELEQCLEIISSTVHDRARTRVLTEVMQASFDGFLLVLLTGGPSRAFSLEDSVVIEEDFKFLTDLFWSNGDGLPAELIEKLSATIKGMLPLFGMDTEHLIQQFSQLTLEMYGSSAKSQFPLPPTSGQWSPREPNTLLRVLCYRNDETAAKFLRKNYNLPKKV